MFARILTSVIGSILIIVGVSLIIVTDIPSSLLGPMLTVAGLILALLSAFKRGRR